MDYMDLIAIETPSGIAEIFEAPGFSHIEPEDYVLVPTEFGGTKIAEVKATYTLGNYESDCFRFLVSVLDLEFPLLRVLATYSRKDLKYAEPETTGEEQE